MGKKIHDESQSGTENHAKGYFYFAKENYKWMLIGLLLILVGYALMTGADANTVDGKYDPTVWNEGIFSVVRIRVAPFLVVLGLCVEAYAILKRPKDL